MKRKNRSDQDMCIWHSAQEARRMWIALPLFLRADGYRIVSGPRMTGDGYYESVILDDEGNQIEITI